MMENIILLKEYIYFNIHMKIGEVGVLEVQTELGHKQTLSVAGNDDM